MSPLQHDDHLEIEHLREELHELRRRVEVLEHMDTRERTGSPRPQPIPAPIAAPATVDLGFSMPAGPNPIPVLGRAVLGLAGAYLLRALAETSAVPRLTVIAAAIAYAFAWLIFSIWDMHKSALAGTTYAVTASLILAPLLWESTVRFDALAAPVTAGILILFVLLSVVLPLARSAFAAPNPHAVATVSTWSALLASLVLMIQTGDLLPFELAILAIAALTEAAACFGHSRNTRAPAAIAADIAIWALLFVMTRPGGVPEHYRPIGVAASVSLCAALLAIYAASTVWQTVVRPRAIAIAETIQTVAVFVLAAGGALVLTQNRAAAAVGTLAALGGAACYFAAFTRFAETLRRNHHVYAAWGAALGMLACVLILAPIEALVIWSAAAVLALLAGARIHSLTLIVHGNVYLAAAAIISGLGWRVANAFTGATLDHAELPLWIIAISAGCCYGACLFAASGIGLRASILPALLLAASVGSLLVLILGSAIGKDSPSIVATSRTLVTCGLALVLAFAGSHRKRRELIWLSYAAIGLGTIKLITEDFRRSHPAALAVSLVFYGVLLILVPKLSAKSASDSN